MASQSVPSPAAQPTAIQFENLAGRPARFRCTVILRRGTFTPRWQRTAQFGRPLRGRRRNDALGRPLDELPRDTAAR